MTIDSKENLIQKPADVIEYLADNPDFFLANPEALEAINLKHECGAAESLIERQVAHLRKINKSLRTELHRLITIARDNDKISEATHRLTLEIMQSGSKESVLAQIKQQMRDIFNVDYCEIIEVASLDKNILTELKESFGPDNIFLGRLTKKFRLEILQDKADAVKSVACVYLNIAAGDRLFVLGSKDSDRYQEGIGTHFLLQLGDLIIISLYQKLNLDSASSP